MIMFLSIIFPVCLNAVEHNAKKHRICQNAVKRLSKGENPFSFDTKANTVQDPSHRLIY